MPDRTNIAIRCVAACSVATVAGIAAVISYGHAFQLVVTHGEAGATARALPLTVDGLIVTCSLVLLDAARRRQRAPALAWWLLSCGIVATLGANVAHGVAHGPVGAIIAGWPALVTVGSFEMLARLIRGGRVSEVSRLEVSRCETVSAAPEPVHAVPAAGETPALAPPEHRDHRSELAFRSAPLGGEIERPDGTPAPAAPEIRTASSEIGHGAADLAALEIANRPGDPVISAARERFAETLSAGAVPSVRAIKRELRVGHPRAAHIRAVLAES